MTAPLRFLAAALCLVVSALPAQAAFETRATAAWIYDLTNDTVLSPRTPTCRCRPRRCRR
jgi:serine-type D-Ala-D-Ala carboxypeptidase (penicillin-binding protein 5/6)